MRFRSNVILDVFDVPDVDLLIETRASHEEILIVGDSNSVDRVFMLKQSRHQRPLRLKVKINRVWCC